jgi:hypothetical protein
MIKEDSMYQDRWYVQKKGEKDYLSRSTSVPRLGLGGLSHKKRREKIIKCESYRQLLEETVYVYIFEPIPEKIRLEPRGLHPSGALSRTR